MASLGDSLAMTAWPRHGVCGIASTVVELSSRLAMTVGGK